MAKVKAIIFDLDGTVLDTENFICSAFAHSCRTHKLDVIDRSMVAALGGAPLIDTYLHYYPSADMEAICETHRNFQLANGHLVQPFPSTVDTLRRLRVEKIPTAIATTRKTTALHSLRDTGVDSHFDTIVTGDDVERHKPHPEALLLALERLGGIAPTEAVMVGDMTADVLAGKNAKMKTIAIAGGLCDRYQLEECEPDYIVEDLAQILPIVIG